MFGKKSKNLFFNMLLVLVIPLFLLGCKDDDKTEEPTTAANEFELIRSKADTWLSTASPIASAADVNKISAGIKSSSTEVTLSNSSMVNPADYIILSVRGSSDYAKGHVPGAFNIEYKEVADRVSELDKNKKIMVYCYTSNTGSIATTGLNLMGYTAMNMKYGMMGYNNDTTTGGKAVETAVNGYLGTADIEITANTATSTYSYPVLNTGKSSAEEIAKARYSSYIAEQKLKFNFTITAQDVKLLVDGKNSSSSSVTLSDGTVINPADYQIVSVRAAQAYAIGHIPTAINIPYKEIAKTENLQKLDPDKTIIVYCYTGHTGGISASILNLLGYKARNLKYGMEGYTTDNTTVKGEQSSYTRFSGSLNYSLEN